MADSKNKKKDIARAWILKTCSQQRKLVQKRARRKTNTKAPCQLHTFHTLKYATTNGGSRRCNKTDSQINVRPTMPWWTSRVSGLDVGHLQHWLHYSARSSPGVLWSECILCIWKASFHIPLIDSAQLTRLHFIRFEMHNQTLVYRCSMEGLEKSPSIVMDITST